MTTEQVPVTVTILGKEYRIACPREEQSSLIASANYLNKRMKEVRDSGKVIGADRVAVMVALNITSEMLNEQSGRDEFGNTLGARLRSLRERIDVVLDDSRQMEL
ncbi:MAG: cell division protein ZapA [Pseudomonadota bacterium]|nr:cell division protein ZapA [Pseudomonadota bacterium]